MIAVSVPISGAFVVSAAMLQGTERVVFLTWVTFLARIVSLVLLCACTLSRRGCRSRFASGYLFDALSFAVSIQFSDAIIRRGRAGHAAAIGLLRRSAPFAISLAVRDLIVRLPSLVLPGTIGFGPAGVFDSAYRIRSSLGMTMGASIVGLMPSFARSLSQSSPGSGELVAYSVKYMCLAMAAVATGIVLLSEWIIRLFFGPAFAAASLPLQILAWSQVLVAVDAVLQQAMLATGAAFPAIRHSASGIVAQLAFILLLVGPLGLPGAALAIVLSSALTLALDLRYVVTKVTAFPVARFAVAPLAAAAVVALALQIVGNQPFIIRVLVAAAGWVATVASFRLLSTEELRFMKHLALPGRAQPTDVS